MSHLHWAIPVDVYLINELWGFLSGEHGHRGGRGGGEGECCANGRPLEGTHGSHTVSPGCVCFDFWHYIIL